MNSTSPNRGTVLPGLAEFPVIGIVRRLPPDVVPEAARAAFDAGLRYLEVTMDSDDALGVIRAVTRHHSGVGVGSVTRVEQVTHAREAGAEFVVMPITRVELIQAAVESGMAAFPGAATPTEIDLALRSGATAVKVFPAEQLGGPGYVRAILSPLGDPPLIPTGGVTPANAAEYLRAGAVALGAGTALFSAAAIAEDGIGTVAARTAQWRKALS
ncbi:MAG TPA: bifunctional 4-hydroxy-2-oxoglutarate aldolase/2-dehydro-3-deoxy-phosphogluconate aldolase [Acidimicrobiia bacterium]|nr:bifunctional 4-hydroxy-2-oxoglutarate aldolase/2-dehydro-3-deoxy-phosphogluconate aldolase [Acidimicrobiia bacterium]